jgi:hypothetical protein
MEKNMRRLTSIILIALLCGLPAAAQNHRLSRPGDTYFLMHLKPGTHIEIESVASSQTVDLDERCRLLSVDATTLTCAADDDRRVRLVFPMDKVEAVYQVHRKVNVGAILGIAVAGTFIGGLAAACAPAIAVGLLGGLVALAIVQVHAEERAWRFIWGIPAPPPAPPDNLTLVYWRW